LEFVADRNVPIEAISARAGVAVSTVYAVFRNKRGILQAIRERWHQESGQRDIYRQALEQSDPKRRLELAAYATRRQWEIGGAMMAIYQAAAAADPDAAAELSTALQGRRTFLTQFIDAMSGQLRLDLSPKLGERSVFHGAYIAIAGVVDKHIKSAERLNCCIDSVPGLRFVRDIQRKGPHPVAVPADKVVELERIAGYRDNAMAGVEGGLRKCSTQPARTTGNEPNLRSGVHSLIVADRHGRLDW